MTSLPEGLEEVCVMSDTIAEKSSPSGLEVTEMFEHFFKNFYLEGGKTPIYREKINTMAIYDKLSLEIDVDHLLEAYGRTFVDDLVDCPAPYVKRAEQALECLMLIQNSDYLAQVKDRGKWLMARFVNLSAISQIPIGCLGEESVTHLVQLDGIVSRLTSIRPEVMKAVFRCKACNEEIIIDQADSHHYKEPNRCPNTIDCPTKRGPFEFIIRESTLVNWQKAKLQELPENLEPGSLPSSIDIILRHDLVGLLRPGDRVRVVGVHKAFPNYFKPRIKPRQLITLLDVNSIRIRERDCEVINLTQEDRNSIIVASRDPFVFNKLVRSMAPGLFGLDDEKIAVLLSLFGGHRKEEGGVVHRGDIHILMIGDPGTGKSSLIRAAHKLAGRSICTSGRGSTAAGLTAAVVVEQGGGFTLEAGALVLADGGICCIDEFEKMSATDRAVLHEAMEQQEVSIAKAGITATLRARTSIIAAANPTGGRFDRAKVPSENIDLPPALLSRFDLIFLPMDDVGSVGVDRTFEAKLVLSRSIAKASRVIEDPPYEREFLKKYIAYARSQCEPYLSLEAADVLEKHYLELRRQGQSPESPVPITLRQLEGLIRLTEAYARAHLRDVATAEDAEESWCLMLSYLKAVGQESEGGPIDIDRIMTGEPLSNRLLGERVLCVMNELSGKYGDYIPLDEIFKASATEGLANDQTRTGFEYLKKYNSVFNSNRARDEWGLGK